jgi:hypothetical protein
MANRSTREILAELIQDTLNEERKLKDSLAQRSVTVISTSGTLVTLTLGVSALVTRAQASAASGTVLVCVAVALVLLFGAAVLALLNNAPRRQGAVDLDAFAARGTPASADWRTADEELETEAHALRLRLAADLRSGNSRRSRYLVLALALECAALAALSVGTAWILLRG